jgi:hypothetical protein
VINANAFEAKTDNKVTAMTSELFVFMPKRVPMLSVGCYDASVGFSDVTEGRVAIPSSEGGLRGGRTAASDERLSHIERG